jgi:hypothetical protein
VLGADQIVKSEIAFGHEDAKACAVRNKILVRSGTDKAGTESNAVINLH